MFAACYDVMCSELKEREGTLYIDDLYVLQATDYTRRLDCTSAAVGCIMKEVVADEA